jgi:hypothetical protein
MAARTSIRSCGLSFVSALPHLGQTKAVPPGIEIACNQSATGQFPKLVHLPRRVLNGYHPPSHTVRMCADVGLPFDNPRRFLLPANCFRLSLESKRNPAIESSPVTRIEAIPQSKTSWFLIPET